MSDVSAIVAYDPATGVFTRRTVAAAHSAYCTEAAKLHGEFARAA